MSRSRWDMPKDVDEELHSSGLEAAYQARPPYQRNDYISWINQAKQESTREKRIKQMLEELKQGDV